MYSSKHFLFIVLAISLVGCRSTRSRSDVLKESQDYLSKNKVQAGVVTLPSGLQYRVVTAAKKGARGPGLNSIVTVHYEGRFVNGELFDSSYKNKKPAQFPVTGVIKGWTEALLLMKVGEVWELVIPHELAYGPAGRASIPGFSTLVFKVELLASD